MILDDGDVHAMAHQAGVCVTEATGARPTLLVGHHFPDPVGTVDRVVMLLIAAAIVITGLITSNVITPPLWALLAFIAVGAVLSFAPTRRVGAWWAERSARRRGGVPEWLFWDYGLRTNAEDWVGIPGTHAMGRRGDFTRMQGLPAAWFAPDLRTILLGCGEHPGEGKG